MAKSQSLKIVVFIFALALIVAEMLTFNMFDLENVSQGHQAQLLQLCHLMSNINIYKYRLTYLCANIHHFRGNNVCNV